MAVEFNHVEILEYLLKQVDLQINAADTDGYTAITMSVEKSGGAGMLSTEMLLKSKADPNLQTARRKTPLKIACNAQDLPMVNLLMNNNVNRRPSAFNLLKDEAHDKIMARIEAEEKRAKDLAEKAEKEKMRKAMLVSIFIIIIIISSSSSIIIIIIIITIIIIIIIIIIVIAIAIFHYYWHSSSYDYQY